MLMQVCCHTVGSQGSGVPLGLLKAVISAFSQTLKSFQWLYWKVGTKQGLPSWHPPLFEPSGWTVSTCNAPLISKCRFPIFIQLSILVCVEEALATDSSYLVLIPSMPSMLQGQNTQLLRTSSGLFFQHFAM